MKLFHKDFSLMVIGLIISIFGSAILRFALSTYVLDLTGRADLFALVFAVSSIPGIVLTPLGGAIADRFNRRNLMVIFDFTSSIIVACSAWLLWQSQFGIVLVGIIMTLLAIISSMYQPTVHASVPCLHPPENLEKANGVVSGVAALSSLAGPVIGGVLYGLVGIEALIILSCAAFFLSAVMEIFIHIPFEKPHTHGHIVSAIFKDIKDGAVYVTKTRPYIFKVMIIAALLNLFLVPFFIVGIPYILRITMASSDTMYGLGLGIVQLSSIIGALSIGLFAPKMQLPTMYRWVVVMGLLFVPMAGALLPQMLELGYLPSFIGLFLFAVPVLMCTTMLSIFVITVVQKETPNALLGKVMALITTMSQCAAPAGQVMFGALLGAFSHGVYIPTLIMGGFVLLIAVVTKRLLRAGMETEQ